MSEYGTYVVGRQTDRQIRPDSGLGVQVKVPETFRVVPSSLSSARGGGSEDSADIGAIGLALEPLVR